MDNRSWFATIFRWAITLFVFGFYIALVFFGFRQNWAFMLTFEYWVDTLSATALALMFRWLYSDSGVNKELEVNTDIKDMETGKASVVAEVNSKKLTGELKNKIDKTNNNNKLAAYKTVCDKKIIYYKDKKWWKFNRKRHLAKWKAKKEFILHDEFNLSTIKVAYYRYDIDEMMSTVYKQPNKERTSRVSKNQFVISSLRTNVITILAIMVYNALDLFRKGFSEEAVVVLLGKLVIFTVNIYTGFNLGREYIKNIYSSNLTDDYVFLKDFIATQK